LERFRSLYASRASQSVAFCVGLVGLIQPISIRDTIAAGFQFLQLMDRPVAVEDVKREVKILKAHRGHENIVNFYNAFEDDSYVYIVME
jgi:serine/threonine protein kinase